MVDERDEFYGTEKHWLNAKQKRLNKQQEMENSIFLRLANGWILKRDLSDLLLLRELAGRILTREDCNGLYERVAYMWDEMAN